MEDTNTFKHSNPVEQNFDGTFNGVSIGHNDGGNITLWAYEDYGDRPAELTPEQATAIGEALIKLAKEKS
jgi:hypothetical protein